MDGVYFRLKYTSMLTIGTNHIFFGSMTSAGQGPVNILGNQMLLWPLDILKSVPLGVFIYEDDKESILEGSPGMPLHMFPTPQCCTHLSVVEVIINPWLTLNLILSAQITAP